MSSTICSAYVYRDAAIGPGNRLAPGEPVDLVGRAGHLIPGARRPALRADRAVRPGSREAPRNGPTLGRPVILAEPRLGNPNRAKPVPERPCRSVIASATAPGSTSWWQVPARQHGHRPAGRASARLFLGVGLPEAEVGRREPLPARRRGHRSLQVGEREPALAGLHPTTLDRVGGTARRDPPPATSGSRPAAARPRPPAARRCSTMAGERHRGVGRRARQQGVDEDDGAHPGQATPRPATYRPALLCGDQHHLALRKAVRVRRPGSRPGRRPWC